MFRTLAALTTALLAATSTTAFAQEDVAEFYRGKTVRLGIGNMVAVNNIMITWGETGVRTIDDAKKRPLAIGATGASSPSVLYPTVANYLFGTQFKIVSGYPGGGDIMIAMERREVDGRGS